MYLLKPGPIYSWKKAFITLVLSTLPLLAALFFVVTQKGGGPITGVIHTGTLQTNFLAELLELSVDQPTLMRTFDLNAGKAKLQATALFKHVNMRKIKPHLIFIDYALREPIALLGNLTNTAIDDEGVLFPLLPAHTPKKLPLLFIETAEKPWGQKLTLDTTLLKSDGIVQVDMTHPREIVLKTEQGDFIRLEKSTQQLPLYYKLQGEVLKSPTIVDLRLKECAFIQEIDE